MNVRTARQLALALVAVWLLYQAMRPRNHWAGVRRLFHLQAKRRRFP